MTLLPVALHKKGDSKGEHLTSSAIWSTSSESDCPVGKSLQSSSLSNAWSLHLKMIDYIFFFKDSRYMRISTCLSTRNNHKQTGFPTGESQYRKHKKYKALTLWLWYRCQRPRHRVAGCICWTWEGAAEQAGRILSAMEGFHFRYAA